MPNDNQFSGRFHDARWHRSRAALYSAILELAAEKSLAKITALEVAERAGVNRSTFYKHAKNPGELLRETLREDLDRIREVTMRDTLHSSPGVVIRTASHNVLVHVVQNRNVYAPALGGADEAALHQLLSGYIESTYRAIFDSGHVELPFHGSDLTLGSRFASRFIAQGTVGVIAEWINESEDLDINAFLDRFASVLPDWFPLP